MSGAGRRVAGVPERVHVVAIGGAGMSAIASILLARGHRVSGSDLVESSTTLRMAADGVEVHLGHDASHLGDAQLVVASSAVPDDNVELVEARNRGLEVLRRADLLAAFGRTQPLLSVSGTHGKTTTTSMLATALVGAGEDPSFLIGAEVPLLGAAAAVGSGRWLVLEADESDASFLAGPRAGAVVTNVDADHLEFWGGWDGLLAGFDDFLAGTDGPKVVCGDDPAAAELGRPHGAISYGVGPGSDALVDRVEFTRRGSRFQLRTHDRRLEVELAVPGLHNVLDAAAALTLVDALDRAADAALDVDGAVAALGDFTGAARRFERRGTRRGVDFVDDYAHLPTEVRAALAAGLSGGWDRVVAVFQPHRFSRTEALWSEFAHAFDGADVLVLTEIYPAGEPPRPGVTGELLVEAVSATGVEPRWCPDLGSVADLLAGELRPGDLCLSLGAGDVTKVADLVAERWSDG